MNVIYYGIPCVLEEVSGRKAVIAAPESDTERLTELDFAPMPDGRWRHFLTPDEYDAVMQAEPDKPVIFEEPVRTLTYNSEPDCTFTYIDGRPALIPPQNEDADVLRLCGFIQMPDGKWVHFLTKQEFSALRQHPEGDPLSAPAQMPKGLDAAGVFLLIVSVLCMGGALAFLYTSANGTGFFFLMLAALITFVAACVRAPKSAFVRLIGFLYILIALVLVYQLITALILCTESCVNCVSCQWQKCK